MKSLQFFAAIALGISVSLHGSADALPRGYSCVLSPQARHARLKLVDRRIDDAKLDVQTEQMELNFQSKELNKWKRVFRIADSTMTGSALLLAAAGALPMLLGEAELTIGGLVVISKPANFTWGIVRSVFGILLFTGPGTAVASSLTYQQIVHDYVVPGNSFSQGAIQVDFSDSEFDAVRNFLTAQHCENENCSMEYPHLPELFSTIDLACEEKVKEIESRNHWYIPQYFSRTNLDLIAEAELPRARARLELRRAEVSYFLALRDELVAEQEYCKP